MDKIKPIAIYLPQFHPIKENDLWWGKGFTEWTNVTKARPRFKDHYQPHYPADLGFYDLRLQETRMAQEEMARTYGIHGFCYYHYWFNGRKILEKPLDSKINNPNENLPFMMCWANENWTRTWNGGNDQVLLKQEYNFDDDKKHIEHLIEYFKDDRYIKVNGKPIFIIYRPKLLPHVEKTIKIWRDAVKKAGFPDLYIGFAHNLEHSFNPKEKDFDFGFQFHPSFGSVKSPKYYNTNLLKRIYRKIRKKVNLSVKPQDLYYDYQEYAENQKKTAFQDNIFPGVTPMWDNSARRKNAPFIFHDSTPTKYGNWLKHLKVNYPWQNMPENFLFINAWNEWAEGNHLEPDQKWGLEYLQITKEILT